MKTLKDKITDKRTGDLSICFEYKDVKQAVLNKNKNLQYKINYLKQQKNENKIYTINAIIGIFEDELKENRKIFGDFEK